MVIRSHRKYAAVAEPEPVTQVPVAAIKEEETIVKTSKKKKKIVEEVPIIEPEVSKSDWLLEDIDD